MSLFNVMDISGTGMAAENVRLNATASNIANANSVSSSIDTTYKARHPVFAAALEQATGEQSKGVGVKVLGIVESTRPLKMDYAPHNPLANEEGYIFRPNVNVIEEMADMMSAAKAYETNVQVADTTKRIYRRVLQLGQSQ
ncbi:MAG: flagellar basal body rod protein FlgC [Pseudomonadota bacterium]